MKHHIRTLASGAALLAAIVMIACGGKQTMASKSAAAYDDARKKGIPIATGEHGGHSNKAGAEERPTSDAATGTATMTGMDHGAMAGMDHSQMPGMQHGSSDAAAHDMAGMDQPTTAGMGHSKMPGMKHDSSAASGHGMAGMNQSSMAGMDHAKMPGMQPGTAAAGSHDMAGMGHSAMPGMSHGSMPGMQHGGAMAGMPGMQHGRQSAPLVIAPPTSNAAIVQTQPAATLRADEFDAPARAAVEEAAKGGASGKSPSMEATPKSPAPPQHERNAPQPKPPSEHHQHGGEEAS